MRFALFEKQSAGRAGDGCSRPARPAFCGGGLALSGARRPCRAHRAAAPPRAPARKAPKQSAPQSKARIEQKKPPPTPWQGAFCCKRKPPARPVVMIRAAPCAARRQERDVPPAFAGAARRACPRAARKLHHKSRLCQRAQTKTAPPQAIWPGGAAERQGRKSGGAAAQGRARRGKPLSVRRRRTPGPRPGRFARWQRRPRPCFAHCFAAHTRRRCRRRW